MLPTEPWRQGPLLKGVVDGGRLLEDVAKGDCHPPAQLGDEQTVRSIVCHFPPCWLTLVRRAKFLTFSALHARKTTII